MTSKRNRAKGLKLKKGVNLYDLKVGKVKHGRLRITVKGDEITVFPILLAGKTLTIG